MSARFSTLPAEPTRDPVWLVVEDHFQLAREHEFESLFAVANGYAGTRGSLAEGSRLSTPATYVAGVFALPASSGIPSLAHVGDWTRLAAAIDGHEIALDVERAIEHRRILDLRQAILWREWRQRDMVGRTTTIRGMRLASLADRHLLLQSLLFVPENYVTTVTVDVSMEDNRSVGPFLVRELEPPGSGVRVAIAAATLIDGEPQEGPKWNVELSLGEPRRLDRLVVIYTSRDHVQSPAQSATEHLRRVIGAGIEDAVAAHRRAWDERWRASDVCIDGDPAAQRAVRFASYHLVSAVNPDDDRVSVGARALTGEAYKGHVFWDTDVFMLPFFALTYPEAARALMLYRHHTLPAARERARRRGCPGALYAWESATTGEDVTPSHVVGPNGEVIRLRVGELEQHISADVAWAVWTYFRATGDDRFLAEAGAEILVETARFWTSRALREGDGRHHIRGVLGPDEYHDLVDDNAYTNVMAQWNLERAAEVVRILTAHFPVDAETLVLRLGIERDEPDSWERIAAAMYTGFNPATGLFEQFQGYFALDEIDITQLEPRTAPLDVLLGPERVRRSKVIKQADVVMLLHLLWNRFTPAVREANFRYYEPRCGHGSSLSPAVHACVAARLGDLALAQRYFRQTMNIDLANEMGNAAGGVHAGALGGLYQAVVYGFAGLEISPSPESVKFRPRLPSTWSALRLSLLQKGQRITAHLTPDAERVRIEEVSA